MIDLTEELENRLIGVAVASGHWVGAANYLYGLYNFGGRYAREVVVFMYKLERKHKGLGIPHVRYANNDNLA